MSTDPGAAPKRILGTTARRVVYAIFVTALIPLVMSLLTARAIIGRVSATAFQPEFGAHLDQALGVYADLAKAVKQQMRAEAEAIARKVLAVDPENQMALRQLGLAITDQFTGSTQDRNQEAQSCFENLASAYERAYYQGILYERRAKAQMRAGHLAHSLLASFENALRCFEEAEKIRPAGNDDALLHTALRIQHGLNLSQFDPVSAHLHLVIYSPDELDPSIR